MRDYENLKPVFCRVTFLLVVGALFSFHVIADPLSGKNLYSDVKAYANFGDHRTGSSADNATSEWILRGLRDAGVDASLQPFALNQFFPSKNELIVAGQPISIFPHWFPKSTVVTSESGLLSHSIVASMKPFHQADLSGAIAYLSPEKAGLWYQVNISSLAKQAANKGALALVVAIPHPSGEIYMRNAAEPWLQKPLPIPAAVIASGSHSLISQLILTGHSASLTLSGSLDEKAQANNVIGRLERGKRWIVVSTPTSGWFQAAGERGGGVALFLGLARWLPLVESNHSILFVANSGHELNYMGAHQSMNTLPSAEQVDLWLHLGASIGARRWSESPDGLTPLDRVHQYNLLFAHPRWLSLAKSAFKEVPDLKVESTAKLPAANGELVGFIDRGYPALGMVGNHRFFHTPRDLADVTSEQLLAPYGQAVKRLMIDFLAVSSKRENAITDSPN